MDSEKKIQLCSYYYKNIEPVDFNDVKNFSGDFFEDANGKFNVTIRYVDGTDSNFKFNSFEARSIVLGLLGAGIENNNKKKEGK